VIQHCQGRRWTLIGTTPRLFYPEFMASLGRFTAHVDDVGPSYDVGWHVHDAVILFIVHDIETMAVFVREHNCALFKVSGAPTRNTNHLKLE
jgi:hypothetical protein